MSAESQAPQQSYDTGILPSELDPLQPRVLRTPWGEYSLFQVRGELFAVQSFCPHLAGPLYQGTVSGESIVCPWHLWRFSLRTGRRLGPLGALAGSRLSRCRARIGARGTIVLAPPEQPPFLPP